MVNWCSGCASLLISAGSLIAAMGSVLIAKSSLIQSKLAVRQEMLAVEHARMDWIQRKWYDLYFKANQAHDALDEFQSVHSHCNPAIPSVKEQQDFNLLAFVFREAHTMALVFPKTAETDALFASTTLPNGIVNALSKDQLHKLSDAVELLRQKALLDPSVLTATKKER